MSAWHKLLEHPSSRGHFVQLYEADETALIENVGRYLWEGLRRGDGALVIATPEHAELFCRHLDGLGADLAALLGRQQLIIWDAQQTLSQFMAGGQPDWHSFERTLRIAMRQLRLANDHAGLRAYGEMVGILWKGRQFAAAVRLEQFWNKLLERYSFSLYCAYAIDVFGKDFQIANLDRVLCARTHLMPAHPNGRLETALNLALDELLGEKAGGLQLLIKQTSRPAWPVLPNAEAMVLWLRNNLPGQAEKIITRARHYYSLQSASSPQANG